MYIGKFMNCVVDFIKKETVLCIALLLAVVSAFIIPPDREYIGYIDFRTLAILFCLMSVMAGMQKLGVFKWIAHGLLRHVKNPRSLVQVLILMCFFFAMFITNDVALITFVPFTFTVLGLMGKEQQNKLILPLVALQTIAANLGSMLTPIGNPQNLYLYGKAGMSIVNFIMLMLPYTLFSLVLLLIFGTFLGKQCKGEWKPEMENVKNTERTEGWESADAQKNEDFRSKKGLITLAVYLILFLLCLLTVAHVLPWQAVFVIVFAVILVMDRKILKSVDYSLLLTFVGFFVFIGNVGRIDVFRSFLQGVVAGREVYASIAASQIISNVPAALLLSGFTQNYEELLIGVNLGGLGTLIASMASLISYKYVAKQEPSRKGEYIRFFTISNVCFLAMLVFFYIIIK
ncbi:MAG: SLC13 family permease [Butyrivibrio sp.]|nr:SLC13 family permease [Butyrivibrio sp.]